MRIVTLTLKNFRSHQETVLDFDRFNFVRGPNGCGKSSIQMALEYLFTGRCERTGAIVQSPENAELCARICKLAELLGYHAAKTKMLARQWRQDLAGLVRKLQNELDEGQGPMRRVRQRVHL